MDTFLDKTLKIIKRNMIKCIDDYYSESKISYDIYFETNLLKKKILDDGSREIVIKKFDELKSENLNWINDYYFGEICKQFPLTELEHYFLTGQFYCNYHREKISFPKYGILVYNNKFFLILNSNQDYMYIW